MEAEKCAKHEEGQSTCRAPLENRRKKKKRKKSTFWVRTDSREEQIQAGKYLWG